MKNAMIPLLFSALMPMSAFAIEGKLLSAVLDSAKFDASLQANECKLTAFHHTVYKTFEDNSEFHGHIRRTFSATAYETNKVSCLEKFGVVQYIKGCVYDKFSDLKTGEVILRAATRDIRGQEGIFIHRDWEVDTVDKDPMYATNDTVNTASRHDGWFWPKKPLNLKSETSLLLKDFEIYFNTPNRGHYYESKPTKPLLFNRDMPKGGDVWIINNTRWSVNTSLLFKTCIYRIEDIPKEGNPKGFDVPLAEGGPFKCVDWNNSYIYNDKTNVYDTPETIDPVCSDQSVFPVGWAHTEPTQEELDAMDNLMNLLGGGE